MKPSAAVAVSEAQHAATPSDCLQEEGAVVHVGGGDVLTPCCLQVILCTNIAETSVTVPGVRYVVDTGFVKARAYSGKAAAECLQVVPVSQAQARQRAGRAGAATPSFSLSHNVFLQCLLVLWCCMFH